MSTSSSKSPNNSTNWIEVVKVVDLNESRFVERELMLVKVRAVGKDRDEFPAIDRNLPRQRY